MQISVIPQDKTIVKNGAALVFDFVVWPPNLRAMQWNGACGSMEFETGASQWFDNASIVQGYITAYDNEATRIEQVRIAAEASALEAAALAAAVV